MTLKTLLVSAVLGLAPLAAAAQCVTEHLPDQQALTCLPGTMWDIEAGTCVPVMSS